MAGRLCFAQSASLEIYEALKIMKYENYHLPSGVDFSSITYEDIRWQYGVFRCNSTGSGRDKKHFPWNGVKTNIGEIEEKDWCRLAEAIIERDGETHLLTYLIQWCTEHNYIGASAAELRKEALQLHIDRIFDNPQWGGYLPFNKRYRPEVWRAAHIVYVRNECCRKISPVTQEQIDHVYKVSICIAKLIKIARMATIAVSIRRLLLLVR